MLVLIVLAALTGVLTAQDLYIIEEHDQYGFAERSLPQSMALLNRSVKASHLFTSTAGGDSSTLKGI